MILHYRRGDVGGRTVVYAYADNNTERSSLEDPFFILDDHLEQWLWFHVVADKDALTIELTIVDHAGTTLASETIPMIREDGLFEHVSMSFFGAMEAPDDEAHYTLGEVIVADGPIAPPAGFIE